MAVFLSSALSDPDWLPHTYDYNGGQLTFVNVPRPARAGLTFLTDECYLDHYPKQAFPDGDVTAALDRSQGAPLHFIFHTSFCCSTLLAKALELPGRTLSLKEPNVLLHLANRLIRSDDEGNNRRLDVILRLLQRPYAAGETVIVKPTNFANRLLLPALARERQSRAVLLYSDLPTLLRSLANKGIQGRIFGRQLYRHVVGWTDLPFDYRPEETFDQTDLQIAGLAWLMQIHHFGLAARQLGPDRVMLLDSADFMKDLAGTLDRVGRFFGLELDAATADAITAGPVFSQHSKLSVTDYSIGSRERDQSAAVAAHGEEIDIVAKWIAAVAAHAGTSLFPAFAPA